MIVLLDTSTSICRLQLVDGASRYDYEWQADRELARKLHAYVRDRLAKHEKTIHDISGIGVMSGPGSFTGLRIGITIMNTLAENLRVPIVATRGDDWQKTALSRLRSGDNDVIIIPHYGAEAHITQPRK